MERNEAIEVIKRNYPHVTESGSQFETALRLLIPELKENEDERIRKELLNAFQESEDSLYMVLTPHRRESFIAWLEKQGEQIYPIDTTIKDKIRIYIANHFTTDIVVKTDVNSIVKAMEEGVMIGMSEQKPAVIIPKFRIGDYVKNVNDKREPIYEIVYMDKECYVCEYRGKENMGDKAVMHFAFDYPYLRHIQKPAWSEEDERKLELLKALIEDAKGDSTSHSTMFREMEELNNWLKSLKERVLPLPKQEWSEEDRKIIIELIGIFESAVDGGHVSFPYRLIKDYIRVLKSCLPQNTWKPSEEQVKALELSIVSFVPKTDPALRRPLNELLDQLRAL